MNNSQLAHKWAQRRGGSGKGSNFYFQQDVIYSYGPHYPLACFTNVITKSGFPVVLENSRGYSNSTGRHHSHMRNALHGLSARRIQVPNVAPEPLKSQHVENLAHFETVFTYAINKASKARKNTDWHLRDAVNAKADALDYAHAFGLDVPEFVSIEVDAGLLEKARNTMKAQAAERARNEMKRVELRNADYAEKIEAWRNGADASACELWRFADMPTELRASGDCKRVETSRGAQVPMRAAQTLYYMVRRVIGTVAETRAALIANVPDISGFQIRSIAANGDMRIGCHELTWEAINAFATSQGWE